MKIYSSICHLTVMSWCYPLVCTCGNALYSYSQHSWTIRLLRFFYAHEARETIFSLLSRDVTELFFKTSCCVKFGYLQLHVCVFMNRAQQAVRRLPQKKCPTWSSTSSRSSLTASKPLKVRTGFKTLECGCLFWNSLKISSKLNAVMMSWVCPVHWITVIQISPYVPTEINRSYQMSSFVETKALEQLTKCPVEFVEYPSHSYWRMFALNVTHVFLLFQYFARMSRYQQ